MKMEKKQCFRSVKGGFSLVEVVLAVGVIALAVVALIGLFGPTMGSVKQVVDSNFATAAISRVNAYIQNELTYDEALELIDNKVVVYKSTDGTPPVTEVKLAASQSDYDPTTVDGTPLIVFFSEIPESNDSNALKYDYSKAGEKGYVPLVVQIYELPGGSFSNPFTLKLSDPVIKNGNRIISYTTAKNR